MQLHGEPTGATELVNALDQLGVRLVFGLPGVHNLPIWRVLAGSGIRVVGVRHEQAAVYAADGYARATGRLGVALVTTGPGAANTLAATGEAMASGSPVLIVATDIPVALRRDGVYRGVLHENRDQRSMFVPVTKQAHTVDQHQSVYVRALHAGRLALTASTGPCYLGIPTDLLTRPGAHEPEFDVDAPPPVTDAAALGKAVDMLAEAHRPVVWAGGGALRAGAGDAIGALASSLGAPVLTTYMGRGILPADHPCAVPGPVHDPLVGELWDEADVVVAIGTDFDGMMTQNWALPAPPRLIAINIDERDAGKNYVPDLVLLGDAQAVTHRLSELVASRDGLNALTERLATLRVTVEQQVRADEPAAASLLEIFQRALPPEAMVVVDMCVAGYWLGGYWRVPAPRKLAYPVGWGTLGFAFPASLGAALAGTGPVVCVCGDGGFLFACGELATVVQEQIPVTIVLVDDGGYGMLRFDQLEAGDDPFGVDLVGPDLVALAASFGVHATAVDGFGADFEGALARSVRSDAPAMIVVRAAMRPPVTTSPRWYRTRR
jgi:acetolactate synthase-1/2/3 large subunit